MAPEIIIALSNYFNKEASVVKDARKLVTAGEYEIHGAVQLAGVLKVGENYECTPTPRISGLQVLTVMSAILVDAEILTTPQALKFAEQVIDTVLTTPKSEEDLKKSKDPLEKEIYKMKTKIQDRIAKALPKEARFGQTNFDGLAEEHATAPSFAAKMVI